jgi:hypothetical protein
MKAILYNLALLTLVDFCRSQKIDCSGTHLFKYPRKWVFSLKSDVDNSDVARVKLSENQVPRFYSF